MKPSHANAFRDPDDSRAPRRQSRAVAAESLASMQATLLETDYGWSLSLRPMRAFDALRIWSKLTARDDACSLLYDVALAPVDTRQAKSRIDCLPPHMGGQAAGVRDGAGSAQTIADLADHLGIPVIERFGGDRVVLDDLSLRELVGMIGTQRLRCVLVDGPIESRDAEAIAAASAAGRRSPHKGSLPAHVRGQTAVAGNPLAVEFRAVAAMTVEQDRIVHLDSRTRADAVRLVAENFRHYLAALRDRPTDEFEAPDVSQIDRLLDVSGTVSVRPIETDVYSTSIDVGVSTAPADRQAEAGPATASLIYDLPSHTWHDEP